MPELWTLVGFLSLLVHGVIVVLTQVMGAEALDKKVPSVLKGKLALVSIGFLAIAVGLIAKSLFTPKRRAALKKPRRAKVEEDEDDD